jgi:small subunit ribosomal protein S4
MKIGPKYKIARRLGAPIFEKTQTQKFSVRAEKKNKNKGFSKAKSEYGLQHAEKQKARMFYGVSEKQFSNYVKKVMLKKASKAVNSLYELLEMRLDNAVSKIGFSATKRSARQMITHGHILVNGKKVKVPSYNLKIGDKISIREGSKDSGLFKNFEENFKNVTVPQWISFDMKTKTAEIKELPKVDNSALMFDLNSVIGFYSR